MNVEIWHNILWSKYKGVVFSALSSLCASEGVAVKFIQIADTVDERASLGAVDPEYHRYEYVRLFEGSYDRVPIWKLIWAHFVHALMTKSDIVIIAGYHRIEYWVQLLTLIVKRRHRGVFCDSTYFDRPRTRIKHWLKSWFFRQCDVIFCYGERSRDYVVSHGADPDRVVIRCQAAALPLPYDEAEIAPLRLANRSGAVEFLFVGRLIAEKNLPVLIEAFQGVKAVMPSARLTLIGDGPEQWQLKAQVNQLGLASSVRFESARPLREIVLQYLRATCLVLPSTSEAWGLVVNEALSYGCPVVVSDRCGCVPELVRPGVGLMFDSSSADDLCRALLRSVTEFSDIEHTARMCLGVIEEYSPDHAARQIMNGLSVAVGRK